MLCAVCCFGLSAVSTHVRMKFISIFFPPPPSSSSSYHFLNLKFIRRQKKSREKKCCRNFHCLPLILVGYRTSSRLLALNVDGVYLTEKNISCLDNRLRQLSICHHIFHSLLVCVFSLLSSLMFMIFFFIIINTKTFSV